MTTTVTQPVARPALASRRLWFGADAVVTGANGLVYLAAAGLLVDLLGGDAATWRAVGVFLLAYAAGVALYARSPRSARAGWVIVVANALWVIASLDVAVTGALDLDPAGRAWVVAQAVVVGSFVLLQARVLRARLQA
ncbi:hypothetical protein RB608_09870 [Nocardioides sp. LHD-245]|uniref:hypothetical protein n=1 Tax=Nocardioides sp. LHD-245 TaxID=3051387 RepID=UPI0027E1F2AE|nr:hypothetical protein [Nocardioides sp. LHD-245]